jgi:hypothetical protein
LKSEAIKILREDPRAFFKLLQVFDNSSGKTVPFVLTPTQEEYLKLLETQNRIVIVKARQLGISTVTRAWFLWKAWRSGEPIKHAVISYTRESANHLHSIDKAFFLTLPQSLQRKLSSDSKGSLKWNDTGAELRTFTAGGNGWTLAFYPWHGEKKYSSHPRFGSGGIPPVTEEEAAVRKSLGLNLSQLYWRRQQISSMGWEKFHREYPATIEEAFYSKGISWLSAETYGNFVPLDMGRGPQWTYEDPIEGERYAMGVDVANGTGGDSSTITIVSVTTGQPVMHWSDNKTPPFRFADVVYEVWQEWGEPELLIESNGVGAVLIGQLENWDVPLWKDPRGKDWRTDKTSKIRIYERLREKLEEGLYTELHKDLVEEIKNLIPNKWGSCAARRGHHDDLVTSFALALEAREAVPQMADFQTRRNMIDEWKRKARANKILTNKLPFRPASYGGRGGLGRYR